MNTRNVFKIFYVLIFLGSVVFCNVLYAQDNDPNKKGTSVTQNDLKTNVQTQQKETKEEEGKKIIQEALNAYDETLNAVDHLDKKEKDKALEALERAVGKLDILVGRFPEIAYLPIHVDVQTLNVVADLGTIKRQRDEIESLVKNGYLQAARQMLDYLVSEIRITSVNLPMSTYPTAIRGAAKLIEENKLEEAKKSLATTLSTIVTFENSIPIPVLNSQSLIKEAAKITAETTPAKLSKDKKDEALALLKRAHQELEVAEELGYGKRDWEFAEVHKDIKEIESKVTKNEESASFFDQLKTRIEGFKNRISK